MTLALLTITKSISELSVPGITIRDLNKVKEAYEERDCPVIAPRRNGFITNFKPARQSFGSNATAKTDVEYDLAYRLMHLPIGVERELSKILPDMADNVFVFLDAVIDNDAITGLVDLSVNGVPEFGTVDDTAGNLFHGCDIVLHVLEFQR